MAIRLKIWTTMIIPIFIKYLHKNIIFEMYAKNLNILIVLLFVSIPSKIKILLVKNENTGKAIITKQWNNTVLKTCSSADSWK